VAALAASAGCVVLGVATTIVNGAGR